MTGHPSGVMVGSHDPGASGGHTQRCAGIPERMTFVLEVQVDRRVLPRGAGSAVLSQALHRACPPLSSGWTVLCLIVAMSSNVMMLKEPPEGTSGPSGSWSPEGHPHPPQVVSVALTTLNGS